VKLEAVFQPSGLTLRLENADKGESQGLTRTCVKSKRLGSIYLRKARWARGELGVASAEPFVTETPTRMKTNL
jgi:hypothetical protein